MNNTDALMFASLVLVMLVGFLLGCLLTRQRSVVNRDRKPTEAKEYHVQWNPFNTPPRQSFTYHDIVSSGIRATKQPEDFS